MKLTATQAFSWAHRGVEIVQYEAGQVIDTEDPDLIEVAIREGWAEQDGEPAKQPAVESEETKPSRSKRATK